MKKGRRNKSTRGEKSRERVEMTGNMRKKERGEQIESDGREKMFWVQRFWAYGLLLQKYGRRETNISVLK